MAALDIEPATEEMWWADAACARNTLSYDESVTELTTDEASDAEDESGENILMSRVRDGRTRIVRLPDGDIHVCDDACEYAEAACDIFGRSNGDLVCPHTGRVVHRVCECRTNASTGRSTWSCDPDVQAGTPAYRGGTSRRDMRRASMHAFVMARTMVDTELPEPTLPAVKQITVSKRGARCVGDAPPCEAARLHGNATESSPARPHRTARSANAITNLRREAALIFDKLINAPVASTSPAVAGVACAAEHPELMRHDVLFGAALRKYLKEVAARSGVPSLDDIHNISLAVQNVLKDHTKRVECATRARLDAKVRNVEFRTLVVTLVVSLFQCASATPYMQSVRKGADAFRPFCAGVCYAFKRGLVLPNGTVLIPKCDTFVSALADSRGATANARLKSLHASSHKGMCTLHRCIASVPPDTVHIVFDAAIRAGGAVTRSLAS